MLIKDKRKQLGLTQVELSHLLGVDRSTVSCWETGVSSPTLEKLVKIASVFGCTVDELLKDEKEVVS
jgi:transcriptional regulator with XRE-family HTH domain